MRSSRRSSPQVQTRAPRIFNFETGRPTANVQYQQLDVPYEVVNSRWQRATSNQSRIFAAVPCYGDPEADVSF
eukprot:216998-Pyramimonas_sp.AAC.1